jgi:colanic acid/amylovoran biosynthesis glycosyltransferase
MSLRVGYVLKMFPRLSETFVLNEILELEAQGIEVEIFSLMPPAEPRFHADLARLRAEITYLPPKTLADTWKAAQARYGGVPLDSRRAGVALAHALHSTDSDSLRMLLHGMLVARLAEQRRLDHLHAHFATSATRVAMLAHLFSGISFSFTAHAKDIYHEDADTALLVEALERAAFGVTVTDYNLRHLRTLGPDAGKVRRIHNGVRVHSLEKLRARQGVQALDRPARLVSVGRMVEKKGLLYLIDACAILKGLGVPFQLRLIGGGEGEAAIRAAIHRLDLGDAVELLGTQPHHVVLQTIADSDLMILPCVVSGNGDRDALPTVLLEAMALGVPVVSTDLEGVTEIVGHETTGLLVAQRDSASLASAIRRFVNDAALREECGRAGRVKAERLFDIQTNVAELAALFGQAAKDREGEAPAAPPFEDCPVEQLS